MTTMFRFTSLLTMLAVIFFVPSVLRGHCDTMNGPVVRAAQKALETGNVNFVLVWVQKKDEAAIKEAFQKTVAVRRLGVQAKELADMYFFETLVRIHREGESAPYTGIKPAGSEIEPGIEAADRAVERGSVDELLKDLGARVSAGVKKHFDEVQQSKLYNVNDVEAGRLHIKSYVEFIHYVEQLSVAVEKETSHGGHELKDIGESRK